MAIVPSSVLESFTAWYPSLPSTRETGHRCGCLVLADRDFDAEQLEACGLRPARAER